MSLRDRVRPERKMYERPAFTYRIVASRTTQNSFPIRAILKEDAVHHADALRLPVTRQLKF